MSPKSFRSISSFTSVPKKVEYRSRWQNAREVGETNFDFSVTTRPSDTACWRGLRSRYEYVCRPGSKEAFLVPLRNVMIIACLRHFSVRYRARRKLPTAGV